MKKEINKSLNIDEIMNYQFHLNNKWDQILDAYEVTNDKIRMFMNGYGDYHQDLLKSLNTLPISFKVLSKLNLVEKNVMIKEDQPEISFSFQIPTGNYSAADGMKIVQESEQNLLNQLIEHLNKELETKNNLYITVMINSIDMINDGNDNFTMKLSSNCSVE